MSTVKQREINSKKKIEQLQQENNQLKDRIEKAIEYIEHKKFIREQVILERSYKLDDFEVRELLKILKGEENNNLQN